MKITKLIFSSVGPLRHNVMDLTDDWSGEIGPRILLTGPNGCGKSTVLRAIATLWEAFGYWLDQRATLPKASSAREWLQRWDGCAVILKGIPDLACDLGLLFGESEWCQQIQQEETQICWIGEAISRNGKPGTPKRDLLLPESKLLDTLAAARRKLVLSFEKSHFPNVVYLDAEERRWVNPKRALGAVVADDSMMRWLPRYAATDEWKGQLEASLIALKTTQLHTYHDVIRRINQFLVGKEIDPDIRPGENRIRVKLQGVRGFSHSLDDLSAGEHQVLILIYFLARWAEDGCVVLIDEPDLYLHPSLVESMLATVEKIVSDKNGQLLITSHQLDIWHRYELAGKRIELHGVT